MGNYSRVEKEHERRQKMIIVFVLALAVLFFALRLYITPSYDIDEFELLYDDLCEDIKADGDGIELFKDAKRQMRKAGNKPEVLFFFQFVGIYADKIQTPKQLFAIEVPIREAIVEGRFDDAMSLVHYAVLETDEMTSGRGEVWGKLIRELRARWDNDCKKPVVQATTET